MDAAAVVVVVDTLVVEEVELVGGHGHGVLLVEEVELEAAEGEETQAGQADLTGKVETEPMVYLAVVILVETHTMVVLLHVVMVGMVEVVEVAMVEVVEEDMEEAAAEVVEVGGVEEATAHHYFLIVTVLQAVRTTVEQLGKTVATEK
jgi:hypothetical protein